MGMVTWGMWGKKAMHEPVEKYRFGWVIYVHVGMEEWSIEYRKIVVADEWLVYSRMIECCSLVYP